MYKSPVFPSDSLITIFMLFVEVICMNYVELELIYGSKCKICYSLSYEYLKSLTQPYTIILYKLM